jgi:hypothetical protein
MSAAAQRESPLFPWQDTFNRTIGQEAAIAESAPLVFVKADGDATAG